MNQSEKLFEKIISLPLKDLLILCANSLEMEGMEEKKIDVLFLILETRLQKRSLMKSAGLKIEKGE